MKVQSYTSTPPMGRTACTEPQCLYNGAPYPSPLLVPWSRKSRAIPLLPLWAVQRIQSLSVCTTVHLTPHPFQCRGQERVELYLYSPYGPYGLYRASVPVQRYTLPLNPSSAQVKKEQSYTSTPPMGRTACTEPQCLYNGAPYFLPLCRWLKDLHDLGLKFQSFPGSVVTRLRQRWVFC